MATPALSLENEPGIRSWRAQLELGFTHTAGRTTLTRKQHYGPLRVQRPFYPEGSGVCHVYVLHPPGGLVEGDEVRVDVDVGEGARALLTTPGAAKFYRSTGGRALQEQRLRIGTNALCEWLPQETIAFRGANARNVLHVDLVGDAKFIGWDVVCLGRPHSGEAFDNGVYRSRFVVWRDGSPLFNENTTYHGGSPMLSARWGLGGYAVAATMLLTFSDEAVVRALQETFHEESVDEALTLSLLDGVLVVRYLGANTERAKAKLTQVWQLTRPHIAGLTACRPRIWDT